VDFLDATVSLAGFTREDAIMASVYRIRKEMTASGLRYLVDYRDSTGRGFVAICMWGHWEYDLPPWPTAPHEGRDDGTPFHRGPGPSTRWSSFLLLTFCSGGW